jgi:hypothetical protein
MTRRITKPDTKKSSYYARILDEAERLDFETASGVEGIDEEIALLRMKIRKILEKDPDNIKLLMAANEILTRMVKVRYKMNQSQHNGLREGLTNIIKDIAVPLGIAAMKDKVQ